MSRLYLYLAGRNRRGMKVLAAMQGPDTPPRRVTDLTDLNLTPGQTAEVRMAVEKHKMGWELWVESAKDNRALMKSLTDRGYEQVVANRPELSFGNSLASCPHGLPGRQKGMLRRGQS